LILGAIISAIAVIGAIMYAHHAATTRRHQDFLFRIPGGYHPDIGRISCGYHTDIDCQHRKIADPGRV
jgi:hypothetical protein